MFHYVRVALAAAVALATAAGMAHAQGGPRYYGPQFGPQYSPQFGPQFNYRTPPQYPFQDRFGPQTNRPAAASRGWLGVEIQPLDASLADALKLPNSNGALVSNVQSGSPAATAGIKAGDVILSIDGTATNTARDLAAEIRRDAPNTKVTVTVWRSGAKQDVALTLGAVPGSRQAQGQAPSGAPTPAPAPAVTGAASLGLTLAPATGQANAVTVSTVDRNGTAARAGLAAGDQILAVGDTTVATTADVDKAVDAARQSGAKNLLMRVKSGQSTRFIAVAIG